MALSVSMKSFLEKKELSLTARLYNKGNTVQ